MLLVVLSLFMSLRVDGMTLPGRRRDGKRRIFNRATPVPRLIKFALGGILIPAGALAAANTLVLPNHQTPMAMASLAIKSKFVAPEASRAAQLGNALLRSQNPATKVQGVKALQAMATTPALDELLLLLKEDPTLLQTAPEARALSAALASYSYQAKGRLIALFNATPSNARRLASRSLPEGDLGTTEERGAEAKADDRQPEPQTPQPSDASRLPSFVLDTFLQMNLKEDSDLLAFSKAVAADEGWSETVRGQALQLLAKVGGKDDLDSLYSYLESPSPVLQDQAIKAISQLQLKLAAAPK